MRILQCVGRRIDNPGRVSIALGPDSILSDAQLKESPLSRALPEHYNLEMFRSQLRREGRVGCFDPTHSGDSVRSFRVGSYYFTGFCTWFGKLPIGQSSTPENARNNSISTAVAL